MSPPTSAAREVERGGRGVARKDATEWPRVPLGEVADYINGRAFKPKDWGRSGLPIIRIKNLTDPSAPFDYFGGDVADGHRVDNGELLVSWSATLDAFIWDRGPAVVNQHIFKVCEYPDRADRRYLYFALREAMAEIDKLVHGATMKHVTKPMFEGHRIPLPPLAEQQRIAGLLTEQLGAVERARAAAAQRLAAAESLPAALLREVFEGPQAFGWETRTLGELLNRYNEIIHPGDRKSGEAVFVGLEHIEPHTGRRIGSGKVAFAAMTGRKPTFKRGQIVYGYLRPYLNKVWIADFDGCSSVDQFAFDVNPELADTTFVAAFMRSATFLRRAQGVTTTGQLPRISIDEIAAVEIELPPDLPTQRRLAAELTERLAAAEDVIARCREELAAIEALPAALLRQAFGGSSAPDDEEGE